MTTVSGWLIVKASEHPSIMYLSVAIVGVRFFGIGRSALHYAERLVTHDAVLESVTELRLEDVAGLHRRGATSRKMLGGATVLDNLVGAADHVRDLAPRVLIPAAVGLLTAVASVIAVALLDNAALPLIIGCLTDLPGRRADRSPSSPIARRANRPRRLQSGVLRQFAAMLAAAGDLRANGIAPRVRDTARRRRPCRGPQAPGAAPSHWDWEAPSSCSPVAPQRCSPSRRLRPPCAPERSPIEIVAVLAFLPLALVDSLLASTEAIQQWPALSYQLKRINDVVLQQPESHHRPEHVSWSVPTAWNCDNVSARWPAPTVNAITGSNLQASRGQWAVVTGPSGSGKSTLLTVLLRYLPPNHGHVFDQRH